MAQLTYTNGPTVLGSPGLIYGNSASNDDVGSAIAGAIIPAGVWCELVSVGGTWLAFPLQDTGTTTGFTPAIVGVSILTDLAAEQNYTVFGAPDAGNGSTFRGYPIGAAVQFMRRGKIWVAWDGNTGTALPYPRGPMNVWHSSTGAAAQGVVTTLAASATAGSEIDSLAGYGNFYDPRQVSGTYTDSWNTSRSAVVMDVTVPGHS